MQLLNRLVLIGNGFDLAHGLKTGYRNFIDWYMCRAFLEFCNKGFYKDTLINIERKYVSTSTIYNEAPRDYKEVMEFISVNDKQTLQFESQFYEYLITLFDMGWVDIEKQYFRRLKSIFKLTSLTEYQKKEQVVKLNADFDYIITLLTEYITLINYQVENCQKLFLGKHSNLTSAFYYNEESPVSFINFNYTETLQQLGYANEHEIIHIHGRATDISRNPIIFGYGDETDPAYQQIEDSGVNEYLEHIKSFGYYKTDNYSKLINLIDSAPFNVFIVGHSCGLSDRILLNEIFEHNNCRSIQVFYHQRKDGSDNFKEITQEISRHFKPQNKNLMRRRVAPKDPKDIIPQNL